MVKNSGQISRKDLKPIKVTGEVVGDAIALPFQEAYL